MLGNPVKEFKKLGTEDKVQFKKTIGRYQSMYSFLSQLLPFCDVSLEELYIYNKFLTKKLPTINKPLPYSVLADVDIESYKVDTRAVPKPIDVGGGTKVKPIGGNGSGYKPDELARLSEIIKTLNEIAGDIEFGPQDDVPAMHIIDLLLQNTELMAYIANNPKSTVKDIFDDPFEKALAAMLSINLEFYNKIQNNKPLKEKLKTQVLSFLYDKQEASA